MVMISKSVLTILNALILLGLHSQLNFSNAILQSRNLLSNEFNNTMLTKEWNCSRIWPSLDLFVPIHLADNFKRNGEWEDMLLRSMLLYWPIKLSNTTLRLVLDEEQKNTSLHQLYIDDIINSAVKSEMGNAYPLIRTSYHVQNDSRRIVRGSDRQQFTKFIADRFTDAEYVGFVDTDTFFHSFVDREDIFEDGLPIVHGRLSQYPKKDKLKQAWVKSTWELLGYEEPMNCMSYFPITFKTSHLKDMQDFIAKRFKMPFDEAYYEYTKSESRDFSEFNIFCTYIFWEKRSEYKFYLHDTHPWWDGNSPPPPLGQWGDKKIFDPSMFRHKPFVARHTRFLGRNFGDMKTLAELIGRSFCWKLNHSEVLLVNKHRNLSEMGALALTHQCKEPLRYFSEMHSFEDADYNQAHLSNGTEVEFMHIERRHRIKNCHHTYYLI